MTIMRYSSVFILIVVLVSAFTPVQVSVQWSAPGDGDLLASLDVCHSSTEIFSGQLETPAVISCCSLISTPAPAGVVSLPAQHFERPLVVQLLDRPPKA